ncbi:MAG: hypothetical protein K2O03_11835, partial [Lachnospiraceae bacterium]|nr:hypothetical protein [Lachnospiraceae bacterium]
VYAADGMYYYNAETGKCALGAEYAGTSVQVALLIQAAADSATVNYGLLQAEGFAVAKLFGWDISYVPPIAMANNKDFAHPLGGKRYEIRDAEEVQNGYLTEDILGILREENNFLLDFEYLCFSENYVEEKQVEYVWKLAKSLSGYISERGKEKEVLALLMECEDFISFEEKLTALKNSWLESIGSTVRVSEKEYPVHYGNYGRFTLFQMETLHGKWFVKGDFDTGAVKDGENSWILRENYQDVAMRMQELESGMSNADVVLRDKSYDYPKLNFYLGRNEAGNASMAGCYDIQQKDRVNIRFLHSVVHEYCHYLMLQEGVFIEHGILQEMYNTQLHLLPYYYGMFTETGYLYFQERYQVMKERLGWKEGWKYCFQKLEEEMGNEIRIYDEESLKQLMHFFAAASKTEIKLPEVVLTRGSYYQEEYMLVLGSFSIYLTDIYGEDMLYLIATGNDKVEELTGHTYEEFVQEWERYLQESYGV